MPGPHKLYSVVKFTLSWRDRIRALFGREVQVRVKISTDVEVKQATGESEVVVLPLFESSDRSGALMDNQRKNNRAIARAILGVVALVCAAVSAPAYAIGPNGVTGTISAANSNLSSGTPTASSYVTMGLSNGPLSNTIFAGADPRYGAVGIQVTGTFSATLRFQMSMDEGSTWITLPAYPVTSATGPSAVPVTTTTTTGKWVVLTSGYTTVRVTCSSYTSGTVTVILEGTNPGMPLVLNDADAVNRLLLGNSDRPTFGVSVNVTVPTGAASLLAIEASASTRVRLRSLKVCMLDGLQTTAGERQLILFHTTAASSGGATKTPVLYDKTNDSAFGGTVRSGGITTTPTGGSVALTNALWSEVIFMPGAATTAVPCVRKDFDLGQVRAPSVAVGTANGLALADLTGGSGGTGNYAIDAVFTEEAN